MSEQLEKDVEQLKNDIRVINMRIRKLQNIIETHFKDDKGATLYKQD